MSARLLFACRSGRRMLGMALPWLGAVLALGAPVPPLRVVKDARIGFVAPEDGRLLAPPQYALQGAWQEGRLWVAFAPEEGARGQGLFLDEQAQPLTSERYHDLSEVLPELPLPRFEQGIAVVGLEEGAYGYLDRAGRLLGRTTRSGVFLRQAEALLLVEADGKAGFMDRSGHLRIAARFAEATPFRGGRAAVREGGRWGLLDAAGDWAAPPAFEELWWFADEPRFWRYRAGDRWGLLDALGGRLTEAVYEDFGDWHAGAVNFRQGVAWGLLSESGQVVLPPEYRTLVPLGGDSAWWKAQADDGTWGLVDREGRWQLAPRYEGLEPLSATLVLAQREGLWGIPADEGSWKVPPAYLRILAPDAVFPELALCERGSGWGALELETGRELVPCRHAGIRAWNGFLAVQTAQEGALLDRLGRQHLAWKGDLGALPDPAAMRGGIGWLRAREGVRPITADGVLLWKAAVAEAGAWSGGLAPLRKRGHWGFVGEDGRWVLPERFEVADAFSEGLAVVRLEGRWGAVSRAASSGSNPNTTRWGAPGTEDSPRSGKARAGGCSTAMERSSSRWPSTAWNGDNRRRTAQFRSTGPERTRHEAAGPAIADGGRGGHAPRRRGHSAP